MLKTTVLMYKAVSGNDVAGQGNQQNQNRIKKETTCQKNTTLKPSY